MTTSNIAQRLAEPDTWLGPIKRVATAIATTDHDSSRTLLRHADALARRLAKAVPQWEPAPARRKDVFLDKWRSVVKLDVLDRVLHTAMAAVLADAFEPRYPEGLYSYRRGRGPESLSVAIRKVIRAHVRERPDPRTRGLYVIRFDVASYGDSIPLHDDSQLWPLLHAWLAAEPRWVLDLVRDLARCAPTPPFDRHGVPTGSALCNSLVNTYLTDLDAMLAAQSVAAFRYGDDVCALFIDAPTAEATLAAALDLLKSKELSLREHKLERIWWTGSGRRTDVPGWRPARHMTMCGIDIGFDGTRRVKLKARRAFLREAFARFATVNSLIHTDDPVVRARHLASAAATLLDPRSPLALTSLGSLLARCDCRIQLREIDRAMALRLVRLATGRKGARAFRTVSWRMLHDFGLPSLRRLKNR